MSYYVGSGNHSIDVQVVDDDGLPVISLVASTFSLVSWSRAGAYADETITLLDLASLTSNWEAGGVKERDDGYYRLDLPNTIFAVTGLVRVWAEGLNFHLLAPDLEIIPQPEPTPDPIVVTGFGTTTYQYLSRAAAQVYFSRRLRTDAWDSAEPAEQDKALAQATRLIDQLNYAGDKSSSSQTLQFPRGGDSEIPEAIASACCEVAIQLLDGVDVDREGKNVNIQEHGFTTVRTKRDTSFVQDWVLAGIPSQTAWNFLSPFLRDPGDITLSRVN